MVQSTRPPPDSIAQPGVGPPGAGRVGMGRAALAGALAAGLALAITELLAGLVGELPSLVVQVGGVVIDTVPPAVESFAIALFGTSDKLALEIGIVVTSLLIGALLGIAAARHFLLGVLGLALFAAAGVAAAATDPQASPALAAVPATAGAVAGTLGMARMLAAGRPDPDTGSARGGRAGRRRFLRAAGVTAVVAAVSAFTGRQLVSRQTAAVARERVRLPPPVVQAQPSATEQAALEPGEPPLDLSGLSPFYTPNDDFYRIDTALMIPQVDPQAWRLRIGGMVDRPYELTFKDLLEQDQVEADITLACVSNEVGGHLIGNARWSGVRLDRLLARAGVQAGATQVVGRSVDGFTVGFPTSVATDGREALVAVGMNGEPLPITHGFPARLVVPGLYGYVSATKWLVEIELTTLEAFDAYWVPRGWAKQAPIKTQSRIDVPLNGVQLPAGRQAVAGVAWAPTRGIARVEVGVDDGPWQEARLGRELNDDTWRQWVWEWDAVPGSHVLRVRATDQAGETQTAAVRPPRPDGATGWHEVRVTVS